jgi:hypothetical protein
MQWNPAAIAAKAESLPVTDIESRVTRRVYRCRAAGKTVFYPAETGIHLGRGTVAKRENKAREETENRRFVRSSTAAWGELWASEVFGAANGKEKS